MAADDSSFISMKLRSVSPFSEICGFPCGPVMPPLLLDTPMDALKSPPRISIALLGLSLISDCSCERAESYSSVVKLEHGRYVDIRNTLIGLFALSSRSSSSTGSPIARVAPATGDGRFGSGCPARFHAWAASGNNSTIPTSHSFLFGVHLVSV